MKKLYCLFSVLAVLLTNVMCAVVGFHYGHMAWGVEHAGGSGPTQYCIFPGHSVSCWYCHLCDFGDCFSKKSTALRN